MKLVVGLGNPGIKYVGTRHNVGFMVVEAFAREGFSFQQKFSAEVSQMMLQVEGGEEKVLLVKPQTFMNASGRAVAALVQFYKLVPARDCVLVYDDVDMQFGQLRVRLKGRAGGHNGLKSIFSALGTDEMPRVRFGIANEYREHYDTADFVLANFSRGEQDALPMLVERACQALEHGLYYGFEATTL